MLAISVKVDQLVEFFNAWLPYSIYMEISHEKDVVLSSPVHKDEHFWEILDVYQIKNSEYVVFAFEPGKAHECILTLYLKQFIGVSTPIMFHMDITLNSSTIPQLPTIQGMRITTFDEQLHAAMQLLLDKDAKYKIDDLKFDSEEAITEHILKVTNKHLSSMASFSILLSEKHTVIDYLASNNHDLLERFILQKT